MEYYGFTILFPEHYKKLKREAKKLKHDANKYEPADRETTKYREKWNGSPPYARSHTRCLFEFLHTSVPSRDENWPKF